MEIHWIPGPGYFANSYVYGSILIDAGVLPMAVEQYRHQIEQVVITHSHYDHIAHLTEIANMCDAEICIHPEDAETLTDERLNLALLFGERCSPALPVRRLNDADTVGALRVIHTPGHTPGSICLYDEEEKTLFSGDTIFTGGGVGRTDFPGGNVAQMKASVRKLTDLPVEGLYPGHGEPVSTGGHRHLEAAMRLLEGMYV